MALVKCQECGKEVSDKAANCPNCGCPIAVLSKVMVYGYTQTFLVNPKVIVYMNGQEVGSVANGGVIEIPITETSEVEFKCSLRKSTISAPFGQVTKVKISWNRLTGKMIPQVIDSLV